MVSSLVLVAYGCSSFLSTSSAMVSANTKQNQRQNRSVFAHKGAQTSAVIKFLSIFTKHTCANCNQPMEPAENWRSDCLEKQSRLIIEICGVLGRLHSSQGLAQSNNNAKLSKC
jgi:RNase P subunit RPR2